MNVLAARQSRRPRQVGITMKKKTKAKAKRTFKRGQLKKLLGIPEPKGLAKNDRKYCLMVARLMAQKIDKEAFSGMLREKAVYYKGWYTWRAKNKRETA